MEKIKLMIVPASVELVDKDQAMRLIKRYLSLKSFDRMNPSSVKLLVDGEEDRWTLHTLVHEPHDQEWWESPGNVRYFDAIFSTEMYFRRPRAHKPTNYYRYVYMRFRVPYADGITEYSSIDVWPLYAHATSDTARRGMRGHRGLDVMTLIQKNVEMEVVFPNHYTFL